MSCVLLITRVKTVQQLRNFSNHAMPVRKLKNKFHIFSSSFAWGSSQELTRFIARNVIFNKDGLVVINKPNGVGKQKPIIKNTKVQVNTATVGENYFLDDILPMLSRLCGYENLEVVKSPERFTSGVTILASTEELFSHVKECLRLGKAQESLLDKFLTVNVYQPNPESNSRKYAIKYEINKVSNITKPFLSTTWTKKAVQRGEAVPVTVEHKTLCTGAFGSLVEVTASRSKNHFLRLYMSELLSPILGDNLYGSLVQKIGGVPILINKFSDRAQIPPRHDDALLFALDLKRGEEVFIPAHVHLHQLTIPHYYGKGSPLVLEAPVPEFFEWTCKQFCLKLPQKMNCSIEC